MLRIFTTGTAHCLLSLGRKSRIHLLLPYRSQKYQQGRPDGQKENARVCNATILTPFFNINMHILFYCLVLQGIKLLNTKQLHERKR